LNKFSDKYIPRTPVKGKLNPFNATEEDEYFIGDYHFDGDNVTKNSEPKNYYKEYMSIKDSIFSGNLFGINKRRNSLE
jgi:hypothetical protein